MNPSIVQENEDAHLEHQSSRTATFTLPSKPYLDKRELSTATTETFPAHTDSPAIEQASSTSQNLSIPPGNVRQRESSLRKKALLGGDSLRIRSSSYAGSHVGSNTAIPRRKSDTSPKKRPNIGSSIVHTSRAQCVSSSEADIKKSSPDESNISTGSIKNISQMPSPPGTYTSTTDDEESNLAGGVTTTAALAGLTTPHTNASHASTLSYSDMHLAPAYSPRLRSSKSPISSPLASVYNSVQLGIPTDGQLDYGETARWGWAVLISTWIVFVVGMGSCLGIWSWAWDVGETPYAPPELEDDDTLPIVGYYPALMILTGAVMSWVWVVVAWVGMKYFRHAKMAGEEGR